MTFPHIEPPTLPYAEVAERYEQSARFFVDALDWASTHGDRHAAYCDLVMDLACDLYRDSSKFVDTVNDICDGVDEL